MYICICNRINSQVTDCRTGQDHIKQERGRPDLWVELLSYYSAERFSRVKQTFVPNFTQIENYLLNDLQSNSDKVGIKINVKKTEIVRTEDASHERISFN